MTYMLILNYALKLVEEIILYYDARSKNIKWQERVGQVQPCSFPKRACFIFKTIGRVSTKFPMNFMLMPMNDNSKS